MFGQVLEVLTHLTRISPVEAGSPPAVYHGSATALPWPNDFFDAVLTDPPYCLAPGTLILTDRGYVPIEQVQIGDRVLSHKGRWAKVTRLYRRHYRGPIVLLKVAHFNQPLRITPEHPVRAIAAAPCKYKLRAACSPDCAYFRQQGRCAYAQFDTYSADWIPAGRLCPNDFIFMPTLHTVADRQAIRLSDFIPQDGFTVVGDELFYEKLSAQNVRLRYHLAGATPRKGELTALAQTLGVPVHRVYHARQAGVPKYHCTNRVAVDDRLLKLIGYFIGDGYANLRHDRGSVHFTFHVNERDKIEEVKQLMRHVFGIEAKKDTDNRSQNNNSFRLNFYNKPVAEFFRGQFYTPEGQKILPSWVLELPEDCLVALVRGYWLSDGSKCGQEYRAVTVSPYLAGQLRVILQKLGVVARVFYDRKERQSIVNGKVMRGFSRFHVIVSGKSAARLAECLGEEDKDRGSHRQQGFWGEGGYWVPIKSVEVQHYEGMVYNLETEDHSYTTAQGCVHNCDNVPYADLSDFFYSWLKRVVGDLYPDLFATPLTPKSDEIIADASKRGGMEQALRWFYERLTQAFREIHRVLKPDGIAVIVFAHKTTEAWETVINALLEAGLYLTASWPIHTEMQARLRAQESAALASSIYMVCRKRPANAPVGEFPTVRREIEERVRQKLSQFWDEGIRGADFFMSAIGPAVEAFGKYARVEKLSGEPVTVQELLEYVRKVVSEFALERILQSPQLGGVDAETRFYLLYRWTYNHARVHFDEARKLAQGVGVELTELWDRGGLVRKQKEYVCVPGPAERGPELEKAKRFTTMIDALHYALYLWSKNDLKRLAEHLNQTYGANETFWQVAQAISEALPEGDQEKQWLQGLLYGRRTYTQTGARQPRLLDEGGES